MVVIPYYNQKSIDEIKEVMLKNEFVSNMISFNVTPKYNYKLEYDSERKTLTIDTSIFKISVTDGWHRVSAVLSAVESNKNLEGELLLKITNTTVEGAQKWIRQQSKFNPQDVEYMEKFNPDNTITMFINEINSMGTSKTNPLYRRIDTEVNTPNTWIDFEMFKEGLEWAGFNEDIIKMENDSDIRMLKRFIVEFFDNLYKVAEENGINIEESKVFNDPTFIMGLLITCHKYSNSRDIDIEAMDKFVKKIKRTKTKFTYDYPIKPKEKQNMIHKFKTLLEG
jgi:hypothetical protein